MSHRYRAHGLLVDSDTELPLGPADPSDPGPADLVLRRGTDRPVRATDPPGQVLARLADPTGRTFYCISTDGTRTRLRYPGLGEFVGDSELHEVTVHLVPGADPGVIPVLAAGTLLAVHLRLRGDLVLHASAVRVGDGAVAFVGASGMGKSTMATVLCAHDHALLSDDVLRVRTGPDRVLVHPGSTETRLRDAARPLAEVVAGTGRQTADGRLAVRPAAYAGAPLPLLACVVPRPSRDRHLIEVRRLAGPRALMLLARFPRILGWSHPAALARDFQLLGELVELVGVHEAHIPWGPPFARDLADQLLSGVGLAQR
jgi:hypothetical protein